MWDVVANYLSNTMGYTAFALSYGFGFLFVMVWFFSFNEKYNQLRKFNTIVFITLSILTGIVIYGWSDQLVYVLKSLRYTALDEGIPENFFTPDYFMILFTGVMFIGWIAFYIREKISRPIFYLKKLDKKYWNTLKNKLGLYLFFSFILLFSAVFWSSIFSKIYDRIPGAYPSEYIYKNNVNKFLTSLMAFSTSSIVLSSMLLIFLFYSMLDVNKRDRKLHYDNREILELIIFTNLFLFGFIILWPLINYLMLVQMKYYITLLYFYLENLF